MPREITAYSVLGVERTASAEEIKAAYKAKAAEHHPDQGGDAAKMARVNLAWSKLRSPEEREAYDRRLADLERVAPAAAPAGSATPDELTAEGLLEKLRRANVAGTGAGELFAEMGQASGFLDAQAAERVRAAAQKGASLGKDLPELIGLVRGHQR